MVLKKKDGSSSSETTSVSSTSLDLKEMAMDAGNYLDQLGQFGLFQLFVYIMTVIPAVIAGAVALQNVFVMGVPKHRCFIPDCDDLTYPDITNEKCSGYSTAFDTLGNACLYNFSASVSSTCDRYVFSSQDFTSTVSTEVSTSLSQRVETEASIFVSMMSVELSL